MLDLRKISGLTIGLDGNKVVFNDLKEVKPDIRSLEEMKDVLIETSNAPKEFYYMYREVCLDKDKKLFAENNLRYDLTLLPPFKVGKEFNKTLGHYHPTGNRQEKPFPEVYEVLHGEAIYLLQNVEEVKAIKAKQGDKILIEPGFGHVTINLGKEVLLMSNLVERNFKSIYEGIKKNHGAMYYYTTEGWLKNKNYKKVPELKIQKAKKNEKFGLSNKPLYTSTVEDIKKFEYLTKPDKYF